MGEVGDSPLRSYVRAVQERWVVLLTGSFLAVFFLVIGLRHTSPPWWLSLVAIFGALSVAQYQVWRSTARERDRLRGVLVAMNLRTAERAGLGLFIVQGIGLLAQATMAGWYRSAGVDLFTVDGGNVSKVEASSLPTAADVQAAVTSWISDAREFVESRYNIADAAVFGSDVDIPELEGPSFDIEKAPGETLLYERIQKRIYRLQQLAAKFDQP